MVAAAAGIKADAAVCQEGAKNRSKRRIILVWPGYTPDYRFESVKVAGLVCERLLIVVIFRYAVADDGGDCRAARVPAFRERLDTK